MSQDANIAKIQALLAELKELGLSQAEIGRRVHLSRSTISVMYKGEYPSNFRLPMYVKALNNLINDIKGKAENADGGGDAPEAFMLQTQKRAMALFQQALDSHMLCILAGQSGSGKSYICAEIAKNEKVIYAKMRKNLTVRGIVDIITHNALDFVRRAGDTNFRFEKLVDDLRVMGITLIVIDEMDLFCNDTKAQFNKKCEIVRELYEAGFSVMIVGLERLPETIKAIGEDYFSRRIKQAYTMKLTKADIAAFYDYKGLPDCPEKEGIVDRAFNNGNLGVISNIYEQYQRYGNIKLANELVFTTQSI